jgi:hypothetical protein
VYSRLTATIIFGLASFTIFAQTTRAELEGGIDSRSETACTAKIASLLSLADKTRLEFNSGVAKTQTGTKQVSLSCAPDGILESIKSLDGSTLRIYQSGYYNGGVVLSFVDASGKHLDMIPFNPRELRELGLNVGAIDTLIPLAPQGLAPGLSPRQ